VLHAKLQTRLLQRDLVRIQTTCKDMHKKPQKVAKLTVNKFAHYLNVLASKLNSTSSSAITKRLRCRVGQFWPKVEDDILQTI